MTTKRGELTVNTSLLIPTAGSLAALAALSFMSSDAIAAEPGAAPRSQLIAQWDVPSVIATVGTVELVDTPGCRPRDAADEDVSTARELVTSDARSAAAARERLVHENLSVFDGAATVLRVDFAQEEFQAQRAELRAARLDLARAEEGLDGAACTWRDPSAAAGPAPGATLEVRMELPAPLLRPLQQALSFESDRVLPLSAEIR